MQHYAELHFLKTGMYRFISHDNGQQIDKFLTARDVAAAFTQVDHDSGWLPAGLVRTGYCSLGAYTVYFVPSGKHRITVEWDNTLLTWTVPLPSMVMLAVGKRHYLAAIKEKHFSRDAVVHHTPLPNVYTNGEGAICWGSNAPPEASVETARKAWRLFIESYFNTHLSTGKLKNHESVLEFLKGLNGKHQFPKSELVPLARGGMTVERWTGNLIP